MVSIGGVPGATDSRWRLLRSYLIATSPDGNATPLPHGVDVPVVRKRVSEPYTVRRGNRIMPCFEARPG